MGVARTFQRNNLFQNLSVMENLRLALAGRASAIRSIRSRRSAATHALIERAGSCWRKCISTGDGARIARNLSYGEQRQLEIGVALAGDPGCCCSTSRPPACRRRRPRG